jgi:UDP-N-acetylmuramate dehydrogenase
LFYLHGANLRALHELTTKERGSLFCTLLPGWGICFTFVPMIQEKVDIAPLTTFGVPCIARRFASFGSAEELKEILAHQGDEPLLILGGGSNVLFTHDFDGLVLWNKILGIEKTDEDATHVTLKVGGGEIWHELVMHTVTKGWGGLENLSLIPGSVGASPIQNIGAYGVEIKDVMSELEALEIATGRIRTFTKEECQFGYRDSIFKSSVKGQYVILNVSYRLSKHAEINTRYGIIEAELQKAGIQSPGIADVSAAVIAIRQSKLPDPKKLGNAGSFFKNPVVDEAVWHRIQQDFPEVPSYPAAPGKVKLAAGWLIEKAGWKGHREANCGVHALQALVLVNYGGCSGQEVYALSERIIRDVENRFGVLLEREVNIL